MVCLCWKKECICIALCFKVCICLLWETLLFLCRFICSFSVRLSRFLTGEARFQWVFTEWRSLNRVCVDSGKRTMLQFCSERGLFRVFFCDLVCPQGLHFYKKNKKKWIMTRSSVVSYLERELNINFYVNAHLIHLNMIHSC